MEKYFFFINLKIFFYYSIIFAIASKSCNLLSSFFGFESKFDLKIVSNDLYLS